MPDDRGAFRSTYESLSDDLDFQLLTPLAQAVFGSLKRKLGQYGIAVFYPSILVHLHQRATAEEIDGALAELEEPKPSGSPGWIVREQHVLWIRNGLRYEPSYTASNPNHVAGAAKFARTLPQLAIVRSFAEYYGLGLAAPAPKAKPAPAPDPVASLAAPSKDAPGIPSPIPSPIPGGITETDRDRDREPDTESETEQDSAERDGAPRLTLVDGTPTRSPAAPEGGTATAKADLPPSARKVLTGPYRWTRGSGTDRQRAVLEQLLALLGDGVKYRGAQVRAVDREHLEAACATALSRRHANPDVVINTVLLVVRDTYTEALAARERVREAAEARALAEQLAAAEAWILGDAEALAAVEREARQEYPEFEHLSPDYRVRLLKPLWLRAYAAHQAAAGSGDTLGNARVPATAGAAS